MGGLKPRRIRPLPRKSPLLLRMSAVHRLTLFYHLQENQKKCPSTEKRAFSSLTLTELLNQSPVEPTVLKQAASAIVVQLPFSLNASSVCLFKKKRPFTASRPVSLSSRRVFTPRKCRKLPEKRRLRLQGWFQVLGATLGCTQSGWKGGWGRGMERGGSWMKGRAGRGGKVLWPSV